jgi:hypothetical protein
MTVADARPARRFLLAVVCLGAVIILVPWQPGELASDIDRAWQIVLHDAFARHAHFGDEIIFTFGPWGFAYGGYDPRTFAAMLAVWIVTAFAIAAALLEIGRRTLDREWQRAAFVLITASIIALEIPPYSDVPFIVLGFLVLRLHFVDGSRFVRLFTAFALGLVALTKFSFLIAAVAVMLMVAVDDAMRRRAPSIPATFSLSAIFFWTLARQPIALFATFLRNSFEVASGYSEAMSLSFGYASDRVMLAACAVLSVAIVCVLFRDEWTRLRTRAIPYLLGTSAILFLAFKAGFVRQDGHDLISFTTLAAVAVIAAPRNRNMLAPVVIALALLTCDLEARNLPRLTSALEQTIANHIAGAFRLATRGTSGLDRAHAASIANARNEIAAPTESTFDVYPTRSDAIAAWNVRAARRPIFQSYSAYTARLQGMNAAHLRGAGAPETLLFRVEQMDRRLPSTEDGLSWPEILARYDPAGMNKTYLVLKRNHAAHSVRLQHAAQTKIASGEPAALPPGDLLFARLDLHPTLAGRIVTTLIRAPVVRVILTTDAGATLRYRIVPGSARAGFVLSPLVRDTADFAALYGDRSALPRVTRIALDYGEQAWLFDDATLDVYRLTIEE